MSLEANTAIIEHLGRAVSGDDRSAGRVNIDSGSHNTHGIDAVGGRLQTWLEAAGIPVRSFRTMFLAIAWQRKFPASAAATGRS